MTDSATKGPASAAPLQTAPSQTAPAAPASPAPGAAAPDACAEQSHAQTVPDGQAGPARQAGPERRRFGFVSLVLLCNYLLCLLMLGTPLWLYLGACFAAAFFLSLFIDAGSGRASRFTQKHARNQSMAVFIFLSATVLYVAGGFA